MNIFSWVWRELKSAVGEAPAMLIVLAVAFAAVRVIAFAVDYVAPGKGFGGKFRGFYSA